MRNYFVENLVLLWDYDWVCRSNATFSTVHALEWFTLCFYFAPPLSTMMKANFMPPFIPVNLIFDVQNICLMSKTWTICFQHFINSKRYLGTRFKLLIAGQSYSHQIWTIQAIIYYLRMIMVAACIMVAFANTETFYQYPAMQSKCKQ